MKKLMYLFFATLFLASCSKQAINEDPSSEWNGFNKGQDKDVGYHPLIAGQNDTIGTVWYFLTSTNFFVEYELNEGWTMSESHVYAGQNIGDYRTKVGAPKVGRFPYARYYNPETNYDMYELNRNDVQPNNSIGFQVAAHCVVNGPNNQNETAWAWGNEPFKDKDWGWFDNISFDDETSFTYIISVSENNGQLQVYELNTDNNSSGLLINELVNGSEGTFDGVAIVNEEAILLVVKDGNELYYNDLTSNTPSQSSGSLGTDVVAESGTYHDGNYYFVDNQTIYEVSFETGTWNIATVAPFGTITGMTITVNDIAWNPAGDKLFIIGNSNGAPAVVSYDVTASGNYLSTYTLSGDYTISNDSQIANVTDTEITVLSPGASSLAVVPMTLSGTTLISDDDDVIVIPDDPGTDGNVGGSTDGGGEVIVIGDDGF